MIFQRLRGDSSLWLALVSSGREIVLGSGMAIIKRYWVAALVMLLVMTHAMIIGYVRSESAKLNSLASSEIPLGMFYVQSPDRIWLTQLRILLAVAPERRDAAKATIEHNRWLVHQTIEEVLRNVDRSTLEDPIMTDLKDKIQQVLNESLHERIIERVLICDRFDLPIDQNHGSGKSSYPLNTGESDVALSAGTNLTSTQVSPDETAASEDQGAEDQGVAEDQATSEDQAATNTSGDETEPQPATSDPSSGVVEPAEQP